MTSTHIPMGEGREFDLVRTFTDVWGDVAVGIGDDAAVLPGAGAASYVVSTDATVEDVHFRRHWLSPREVGFRGTMAAFSDVAAMGANAKYLLVSVTLPQSWQSDARDLAIGIGEAARACGASIVGGNMTSGQSFSVTFTVIGEATTPVGRSGARTGDAVLVTGTLGGPTAALELFERGEVPAGIIRERFAAPRARLAEGAWLARHGATAMIDISDGLIADALHLARASRVRLVLDVDRVPRTGDVTLRQAMGGGEEYELLLTVPAEAADGLCITFVQEFHLPLTRVGEITAEREPGTVRYAGGNANAHSDLHAESPSRVEIGGGHDHFSR